MRDKVVKILLQNGYSNIISLFFLRQLCYLLDVLMFKHRYKIVRMGYNLFL